MQIISAQEISALMNWSGVMDAPLPHSNGA